MKNMITLKMSPELAAALGQMPSSDGVYTLSMIALVGMLAARFGFRLSMQAFAREHRTIQLASAAAWGVLERENACELAFELGGFFAFDRPEDLSRKDALVWLTAVFNVYFEIRSTSELLGQAAPEDVRSWARVLLDSEILGLGNLPDNRTRLKPQDRPWTISTVAIHRMAAGLIPDVYPSDLVPFLEVSPDLLEEPDSSEIKAETLPEEVAL